MNFQNRYKYDAKKDLLGKGGFARVYKAKDILLDRDVAIKVFTVQENGHYTVLEEIKKVIRYEHPNLLRYYDVAILENTNAFGETEELQVGIMELANAGDLKTFAKENPDSPLLYKFLQEVLQGLSFLHQHGIIHRDLKPQNILLVEKNGVLTAKISDFGISKSLDAGTNSASMTIGTIEYMAPEQFSPNKYGINGKISTNLDLWSFGIMVHELITNNPPFGQRSGDTTAEQIMNSILLAEIPQDVEKLSEPYRTIIKKCLVADAKVRIKTAAELISYFEGTTNTYPGPINSDPENNLETQVLNSLPDHPESQETEIPAGHHQDETQILEQIRQPGNDAPASPTENEAGNESSGGASLHSKSNLVIAILVSLFLWFTFSFLGTYLFRGSVIGMLLTSFMSVGALFGTLFFAAKFVFRYLLKLSGAVNLYSVITAIVLFAVGCIYGYRYYTSNFIKPDTGHKYDTVLDALKDSVDLQSTSLSANTLTRYTQALLDKGDTLAAIPYINKLVGLGSTDFTYLLGELYFKGKYVKSDYTKAKQYFEVLPDDSKSQTMLGNMYLMGQGVEQDYEKAIPYYERAASNGNSVAMYSLGLAYFNGAGVEKNLKESKKWFDAVVQKNDNKEAVASAKAELEKLSFYGVWATAGWQIEFATQGIRLINTPKNVTYIGRWVVTGTSLHAKYARKGSDSLTWDAEIVEFTKDRMVLKDKDGPAVYQKINQ